MKAWIYDSEETIGKTLQQVYKDPEFGQLKREDIFVTSKVWNSFHSREKVRENLLDSLGKLQTSYLDLYLIHWPTGFRENTQDSWPRDSNGKLLLSDIHFLETYHAMQGLVREGLVRMIGVSNFNIKQLESVLGNCEIKPVVNQIEV